MRNGRTRRRPRADDVDRGRIFIQAKRRVVALASPTSDLAGALDQFVRQYLGGPTTSDATSLASTADRLVLAAGSTSSEPIVGALPRVLARLRSDPGLAVTDAPQSQEERSVWATVCAHVIRLWEQHSGQSRTTMPLSSFFICSGLNLSRSSLPVETRTSHEQLLHRMSSPSLMRLRWRGAG